MMKTNSTSEMGNQAGFNSVRSLFFLCLFISILNVTLSCTSAGGQDSGQWRQLFNGKDLTGWKHAGPGSMSVENGLLRGHGGMGLLYWQGEKFSDCVIKEGTWRYGAALLAGREIF